MREDWRLGIMVLAAAAFAVAVTGCSTISKPKWTTAHPDTAATTSEPTAHPSAMVERAETLGTPAAFRGFVPRAELSDLRFRPGQVTINKADRQTLDAVARWLKEHPEAAVLIEGHTDDLGGDALNLRLSQERSLHVLVRGLEVINATMPTYYDCFSRLASASGRGKQDLVYDETGEPNRERSRRADFATPRTLPNRRVKNVTTRSLSPRAKRPSTSAVERSTAIRRSAGDRTRAARARPCASCAGPGR